MVRRAEGGYQGTTYRVPACRYPDQAQMRTDINRVLNNKEQGSKKEINDIQPAVKTRLYDGSRIQVVDTKLGKSGPAFTLRRHSEQFWTPADLIRQNPTSQNVMRFLGNMIYHGKTILVSGATGAGKAIHNDEPVTIIRHQQAQQIPFGNLRPGDLIQANDNTWTAVVGVFPQATHQTAWAITYASGESVIVSGNHRIKARRHGDHPTSSYETWTANRIAEAIKTDPTAMFTIRSLHGNGIPTPYPKLTTATPDAPPLAPVAALAMHPSAKWEPADPANDQMVLITSPQKRLAIGHKTGYARTVSIRKPSRSSRKARRLSFV